MRNLAAGGWTNLAGFDCADGGGMSVERHEFDFEGFPISITMDDGADIARFKAVRRQGLGEDHFVVFFDHGPQRIAKDKERAMLRALRVSVREIQGLSTVIGHLST
jgi:hypothetical protein